ncbi:hypothetical protein [Chelativorans sp. Marseille-P2723]|uniref:hypothetical protein n=1 Tax=Chelativorans sp. Marseille-P2723 TaxID=2709133 RepID=UPI001571487B|nr:hypothetical protein [Chelativorans sp. Marseille-P2723]
MSLLFVLLAHTGALANDNYIINQKQTGVSLPSPVVPNGFDEVRAADGTTCRSAMAGSGAYLDSGIIGGGFENSGASAVSAYGRIVVPLGERPARLNCDLLYRLELERLQLEVQMLRRGLDPRLTSNAEGDWASEGWSNEGRTQGMQPAAYQ